jgi:hypothetical protein
VNVNARQEVREVDVGSEETVLADQNKDGEGESGLVTPARAYPSRRELTLPCNPH